MKKDYETPLMEQEMVMTTSICDASQQGEGEEGGEADIKHESLDWGDLW